MIKFRDFVKLLVRRGECIKPGAGCQTAARRAGFPAPRVLRRAYYAVTSLFLRAVERLIGPSPCSFHATVFVACSAAPTSI